MGRLEDFVPLVPGDPPGEEFLDAAISGDIDRVKSLIQQGADKEKQDNNGDTPLIRAVLNGHLEVVKYLVEQGADKEKQDNNGCSPLIRAASTGHLDVVRYLVEQGADKDKQNKNGSTPLIWAASTGHLDVVRYLVEQGADKDKQNKNGSAPLIWAAMNGHLDVVRYLVEQGADKDKQNKNGRTPLIWAASTGHLDVVRYLVEQGADKEKQDNNGDTPLIRAVLNGHLEVVKYLVEQGADKEKQDNNGCSPLIRAASTGHLDVVRYLVEQGADKEKQNNNGRTPLIWAASTGHLDVVRYLVEQGADKDKQNNNGSTPLIWAASTGHLDVVRYLVEQGADKDKQNKNGSTPLIWAAMNGHREVVRYLIEQGADKDGQTAVMWAARNGHLNAIQNLVRTKADPAGIDKDGNTALFLLLTRSDISDDNLLPVAKLLLEHGTPPLLSNNKGESARSVAKIKGFHHTTALVKEYAAKQPVPTSRGEPESEDPTWFVPHETIVKVNNTVLGPGGFGEVYRAKWANSDVVVKEVAVVELRRFLKEVNTWRKLRHANVVPFYGANHRKEPFFIVSQYATEGELVEYLKREKEKGRILVWRKLKEVAAGLGYLHSQGVFHGDLKGNNIVVSDNGIAMLTDFGLRSLLKMKDELGAMAWQPPEFARMTVLPATRKSDVYSFGMCIIEAVTLKYPLSVYDNAEIRQFLRNGEVKVDKPVDMTEPQWNLVKQMIAVSSDDRPNLPDVIQQLEEFADDEEMEEAFGPRILKNTKLQVTQHGDANKVHEEVNVGKTNLACPECEWIASDGDSFCRMCGFFLLTDAVFA